MKAPLLRNAYAIAGASSVVTALMTMLSYRVVASVGDPSQFYEYSTARRAVSFLVPILSLGFGVTLPLRIARRRDKVEAATLLWIQFALSSSLTLGAMVALLIFGFPTALSPLDNLALPILCVALTLNFTALLFSHERGFQRFGRGALLSVLANGVLPVAALLALSFGVRWVFYVWASLAIGLAVVFVQMLPRPTRGSITSAGAFVSACVARLPGDASFAALYFLPVMFAYDYGTVTELSVLNLYFVLLGLVAAAVAPISVVLLPRVGTRVGELGASAAARPLATTALIGAVAGLTAALLAIFASQILVHLLLGATYESGSWVLTQLAPATIGISVFVFTKSVVDGLSERPYTAYASIVALFIAVTFSLLGGSLEMVLNGVNYSLAFLGASTLAAGVGLVWRERR